MQLELHGKTVVSEFAEIRNRKDRETVDVNHRRDSKSDSLS